MQDQIADQRRQENLALVFEKLLTAIERLRSNLEAVGDSQAFRANVLEMIALAEQEGRTGGYMPEDIRVALFAVVALLDESVLNLRSPMFQDWSRKPIQQELFEIHTAGEIFFHNVERLLQTNDSEALADVLEVYELCLLLGFTGKYSNHGKGELRSIRQRISEKIGRMRNPSPWLSPSWKPPAGERAIERSDPWIGRLIWIAIACIVFSASLFIGFKSFLNDGAGQLAPLTEGTRQ